MSTFSRLKENVPPVFRTEGKARRDCASRRAHTRAPKGCARRQSNITAMTAKRRSCRAGRPVFRPRKLHRRASQAENPSNWSLTCQKASALWFCKGLVNLSAMGHKFKMATSPSSSGNRRRLTKSNQIMSSLTQTRIACCARESSIGQRALPPCPQVR